MDFTEVVGEVRERRMSLVAMSDIAAVVGPGVTGGNGGVELQVSSVHHMADVSINLQNMLITL